MAVVIQSLIITQIKFNDEPQGDRILETEQHLAKLGERV